MNIFTLFTLSGPLLGATGFFLANEWLFWIGVALSAVNLFLNVASGVMKSPMLPALFMGIAAIFLEPWFIGLGAGLLIWTALESAGELMGKKIPS